MTRLIDADELKKSLNARCESLEGDNTSPYTRGMIDDCKFIETIIINEQPTVEPKKGKWIKSKEKWVPKYSCSICKTHPYVDEDGPILTEYCPCCGADMRERRK